MFDCHIYKDNHSLVSQNDVHTGDSAVFLIKPILCFSVAKNIQIGQAFESSQVSTEPFKVDLSEYPNGLEVTLQQQPGGGKYFFTAENLNK